jgi:NAD+ synthase (glutamine-hydrolysing)
MVYENGELLAESVRFLMNSSCISADVDLERLSHERMRQTSFGDSVRHHAAYLSTFKTVSFQLKPDFMSTRLLARQIERFPYVPNDLTRRDERCREVFNIQVQGLAQRLSASGIKKVVIGISGGLDSTHALMVCAKTMDLLGWPRTSILAYTLPGYATSQRTLDQAHRLMASVGCSAHQIDIRPSCDQMLKDLAHPYSQGEQKYDITFENVQAGERTSHLFRLANYHGAIVIGTGDLSELALGWCTYGVGDHMSHYNVNASVPKTLIRYLVRWVEDTGAIALTERGVLSDILNTEISPELIPSDSGLAGAGPTQKTEDTLGSYDLQDFNLYYTLRYGFSPSKVGFLAYRAWGMKGAAATPVTLSVIKSTLKIFVQRFFQSSQFKRSCVPNSPKVGSGGSLSPRGDWRAPSDCQATPWLDDLVHIPEGKETS